MKIIEGLKQLRLLEKRMADTINLIQSHASILSNERPTFGETENDQRKEVASMVQSNMDLIREYLKLKSNIEKTNNSVVIEINGESHTITEWLTLYRKLRGVVIGTYNALNVGVAQAKLNRLTNSQDIKVVACFDEKQRIESMRKREDIINSISSRLEIINATTDLVE